MNIGTITCSYFMRIYNYKKPEPFDWGRMTEKYRAEFSRADFLKMAGEIRDLGYNAIEIWEPNFSHFVYSNDDASSMAKELDAMGFKNVVYCIGGWGGGDSDKVEKAYSFAKALGAGVVTGCISGDNNTELLKEMEARGKELNIKFAIENHPSPSIENPSDVAEVIGKYSTVGANVDSGIYNMLGYDVLKAAQLFGSKIYHVHFKDTFKGGNDCMPIGKGDAPMKELLLLLKKNEYSGMVSVEFEFEGDPAPGLADSFEYIENVLSQ